MLLNENLLSLFSCDSVFLSYFYKFLFQRSVLSDMNSREGVAFSSNVGVYKVSLFCKFVF